MDRELVRQQVPAARRLDGVHVTDDVGDRDVRRRELLHIAAVPRDPLDGSAVAALVQELPPELRDRAERAVVHLAPGDDRDLFVQEIHELTQDAALGLTAKAQQDEVVPREHGVHHLRHDGILEPHDAGEDLVARLQHADQVVAHLVLDRPPVHARIGPLGLLQVGEDGWLRHAVMITPHAMHSMSSNRSHRGYVLRRLLTAGGARQGARPQPPSPGPARQPRQARTSPAPPGPAPASPPAEPRQTP